MPPENSDPMRALDGILADPALLSQIQNIAKQLHVPTSQPSDVTTVPTADQNQREPEASQNTVAPSLISALQGTSNGSSLLGDDEYALLQAIRPFLDEEKKYKLDHTLRLLRLWQMAQGLKDYL